MIEKIKSSLDTVETMDQSHLDDYGEHLHFLIYDDGLTKGTRNEIIEGSFYSQTPRQIGMLEAFITFPQARFFE